jgi:hypothetical protein
MQRTGLRPAAERDNVGRTLRPSGGLRSIVALVRKNRDVIKPFASALAALFLILAAHPSCSSSSLRFDCSQVSLDKCGSTPACLPLEGQPIYAAPDSSATACVLPPEFVGCGATVTCDKLAPSRAKDPMGREWVVLSPCLPEGWTQTSASEAVALCPVCETLSLAECTTTTYSVTAKAQQIDAKRTCLLPAQDIGCESIKPAPVPYERRVIDPSGNEWITSTNFIPPGFHDSTSRNTTLGECVSADGGSDGGGDDADVDCEALSVTACAATPGCGVLEGQQILSDSCLKPKQAAGCQRADVGCGEALT